MVTREYVSLGSCRPSSQKRNANSVAVQVIAQQGLSSHTWQIGNAFGVTSSLIWTYSRLLALVCLWPLHSSLSQAFLKWTLFITPTSISQFSYASRCKRRRFEPATLFVSRWIRGDMQNMLLNSSLLPFALGWLTTAILGISSCIGGMIASYASGATSTFRCNKPARRK